VPERKPPTKPILLYPDPPGDEDVNYTQTSSGKKPQRGKMKAAFVTLIRNVELWEIVKSIRQVEDRFNRHYHYPWVFLNEVPFTEEFIKVTSDLISGETHYGNHLLSKGEVN
jgi:hypothetical protein